MFLTSGELTLLAPLVGAPVGAAIAFLATRRTAKDTLRAQREVADFTIRSQREISTFSLDAQREIESAKRIWEVLNPLYGELVGNMSKFVQHLRESSEIDVELANSHFLVHALHCGNPFLINA